MPGLKIEEGCRVIAPATGRKGSVRFLSRAEVWIAWDNPSDPRAFACIAYKGHARRGLLARLKRVAI